MRLINFGYIIKVPITSDKFRTKLSSGNSLVIKPQVHIQEKEDDWLCKQLIYREVYAHDDEYGL